MSPLDSKRWSAQRGAMFVMGIPMCFLMIALLYFVTGLGEDILLRERMQDAADATALSAAVVHARGMNLIALVNQLMAALVSLLIMVRMLQVLCIASLALGSLLSWTTGGASLAVVPPSGAAEQEADAAWEELQQVVQPIMRSLHALHVGVQYGMPGAAEDRALEIAPSYSSELVDFGFAVPGSYPLPLKDGDWQELCDRAGDGARELVKFPLEGIAPDPAVRKLVSSAADAMSGSFAKLFCGNGGTGKLTIPDQLPDVPIDRPIARNIPELKSTSDCLAVEKQVDAQAPPSTDPKTGLPDSDANRGRAEQRRRQREQTERAKDEQCQQAAEQQALSRPGPDGEPNREICSYRWGDDENRCSHACVENGKVCDEFAEKVRKAAQQCAPGHTGNVDSYNYQRRDSTWLALLLPAPGCSGSSEDCEYSVRFVTPQAQHSDHFVEAASTPPCGTSAGFDTQWNAHSSYRSNEQYSDEQYLCVQPHKQVEPSMIGAAGTRGLDYWRKQFGIGDPDSHWTESRAALDDLPRPESKDDPTEQNPAPSADSSSEQHILFSGNWSGATFIHSCDQPIGNLQQSPEYRAQAERLNRAAHSARDETPSEPDADSCGNGSEMHMTMADGSPDNLLGAGSYQMRSLVFRNDPDRSSGRSIIRSLPLRVSSEGEDANPLGIPDLLKNVFAAQAEYYYDTSFDEAGGDDRSFERRKEWLWHMKWKARLRRLRFPKDDDALCGSGSRAAAAQPPAGCGVNELPSTDADAAYNKAAALAPRATSAAHGGGCAALSTLREFESLVVH
jgi:hypothetical protein